MLLADATMPPDLLIECSKPRIGHVASGRTPAMRVSSSAALDSSFDSVAGRSVTRQDALGRKRVRLLTSD